MSSYKEPEWAVQPSSSSHPPWTLSEIKSGVEVARHGLSGRATTILGRAVDMVHLPLHHESVSRQHARIAFDSKGNVWLRDLQSAHGTFVNKRKLPPQASGKAESNSQQDGARGVLIFAGDVLRFGASSRYFSLEGGPPPRSETSREEELQEKADQWQQQQRKRDQPLSTEATHTNTDANHGTHDDAKASGDKTIASLLEDPNKIPEKYRKELDKIIAMKYKLNNLETEDQRIRRKGGGGDNGSLTEGQERQLQRNAEKEATLRTSIREREESLYNKIQGSGSSKRHMARRSFAHQKEIDDDEDDYFDRTINQDNNNNMRGFSNPTMGANGVEETAESEETLTIKWKHAHREQRHLETVIFSKAKERVDALKEKLRAIKISGDEAEAFFVQNDLTLALEARNKFESALTKNTATMDSIETLLNVVNPKLHCDRATGYIGEGRPPPEPTYEPSSTAMQPPQPMLPPPNGTTIGIEACSMPPPPPSIRTKPTETSEKPATEFPMLPPPSKRKRTLGPTARPPLAESPRQPSATTKRQHMVGTLAFLNQSTTTAPKPSETKASDDAESPEKKDRIDGDNHPSSNGLCQQRQPQQLIMGTKSDVWRAPQGQDGSGRTKLNEKFAGRY
eukprot:jgi/Psemu1/210114/e_gw1.523.44.1